MMEKAGVGGSKEGENPERQPLSGPTQLHNLLELVREEQNIFNIIFHEIIRQVSQQLYMYVCTYVVAAGSGVVCWWLPAHQPGSNSWPPVTCSEVLHGDLTPCLPVPSPHTHTGECAVCGER